MTKIDKLIAKFLLVPKDLTWNEYVKVLNHFGYYESKKGKTGGSRVKFSNDKNDVIIAHKPHPNPNVKMYLIEQAKDKLNLK